LDDAVPQSQPLWKALMRRMVTGCEESAFTQYELSTSSPTATRSPPTVDQLSLVPTTVE
jgi:hypothetical protein